jgi:hypothetical protein
MLMKRKRIKRRAKIQTMLRGTLLGLGPAKNLHSPLKVKKVVEIRARHLIRRRARRAARKEPRVNLDRKLGKSIERRTR